MNYSNIVQKFELKLVLPCLTMKPEAVHDTEALLMSVQEVDRTWKADCLEALVHTNVLAH
jgi:hypothetical protein